MGTKGTDAETAHRSATKTLAGYTRIPFPVREELAQEATLRTLTTPAVRDPARFAGKVAGRLGIDWLRRRVEHVSLDTGDVLDPVPWSSRVEARIDMALVADALRRAPSSHRDTLVSLFLEECTIEEVVASRLARSPLADPARERDRLYKRRRRALSWIRDEVGCREAA